MKFLPTENIIYKTKLKEDEIIKRLSDLIEPEKTFRFGIFGNNSTKPYQGQINGKTFDIKRIINYRNSFLPTINGTIEKTYDGVHIKVKMRLHILVIVFLCFWCSGVLLACIFISVQSMADSEFNPESIIPFGMLLFVYGLTMGAFKAESKKSKKDLQNIFEAEMVE